MTCLVTQEWLRLLKLLKEIWEEKKNENSIDGDFFLVTGNFWFNFQTWIFQLNSAVPSTKQPSVKPSRTKLFHSELSVTVLVSESLDFSPLFPVQWKFWVKGGLISEIFFTSKKKVPNHYPEHIFFWWIVLRTVSNLALLFGDKKNFLKLSHL